MFTWICPQCGREVPPAYTECPDCTAKAAQATAEPLPPDPAAPPPPPPASPVAAPIIRESPPTAASPEPRVTVRPYVPPTAAARGGLPIWLMAVVFALAFVGLGAGVYWFVGYLRSTPTKPTAVVESPAAKPGSSTNPYQKYIEVSAIRFSEDPKHKEKTLARFMLTNHSDADISGLAGNVTIWGRTRNSEEDAQGTFSFTADLKPQESKELTAALITKLKIYALPDWNNITPDLQITAPEATPAPQ